MKKTHIINPARFYTFVALLMTAIIFISIIGFNALSRNLAYGAGETDRSTRTIIIHRGETVWSVAESLADASDRDTREIVREIYRLNNLEQGSVQPGQPLLVPGF